MATHRKKYFFLISTFFENTTRKLLKLIKIRSRHAIFILVGYFSFLVAAGLLFPLKNQTESLLKAIANNAFHVPVYYILTLMFYNAIRAGCLKYDLFENHPIGSSAALAFSMSIIIESLRGFGNPRNDNAIDIILNLAGALLFMTHASFFYEFRRVKKMEKACPSLETALKTSLFHEFEILQDKLGLLGYHSKTEQLISQQHAHSNSSINESGHLKTLDNYSTGDQFVDLKYLIDNIDPEYPGQSYQHKVILISSVNRREGKTTVALNLALSLVRKENRRVALLDLNFANPQLHRIFGLSFSEGAIEFFRGKASLSSVCRATEFKNLSVIPVGQQRNQQQNAFGSQLIHKGIENLRKNFDITLIETAPLSAKFSGNVSMPLLASVADKIILVTQKDATDRREILRCLKLFEGYETKIAGTVFNNRLNVP